MKQVLIGSAFAFGLALRPAMAQHDHGAHEQGEEAGHSHEKAAAHGGAVTMSKEFHVETVFMPDQVRLYLYDASQNPMHVKHREKGLMEATGVVDFRERGRGTTPSFTFARGMPGGYACPMHPGQESDNPGKCAKCDMKLAKQEIPDGTLWSCPMHPDENGKAAGKCADCGMAYTPQDYLVAPLDLTGVNPGEARVTINLKNLTGEKENTLKFTEKVVLAKARGAKEEGQHEHGGHDDHHQDDDH